MSSDMKGWGSSLDVETDTAVEKFANEICESILAEFPEARIETPDELINDPEDETRHARRIYVKTNLGCAVICPAFKKSQAIAIVLNLGLARAMSLEGFTDEYIDAHGKIFSDPLIHTPTNVEILSYYLTHRTNSDK